MGRRRALNFGHTFGHAIEELTDYAVPHGQAVAYGMLAAARIGERLSITDPSVFPALERAMNAAGLDTDRWNIAAEAAPLISRDKKADGQSVTFVILKSLGEPELVRLDVKDTVSIL
jgi:3-dehydroquinate synthase